MLCRLCLADNQALFRDGLKKILGGSPEHCVIGEANDCSELLNLLKQSSPDLILIDPFRPNFRGIADIPEIRKIHPDVKILVLTTYGNDAYISRTMAAGADGYLLKEDVYKVLFPAIESIQNGAKYVSPALGMAGLQLLLNAPLPKGGDPLL